MSKKKLHKKKTSNNLPSTSHTTYCCISVAPASKIHTLKDKLCSRKQTPQSISKGKVHGYDTYTAMKCYGNIKGFVHFISVVVLTLQCIMQGEYYIISCSLHRHREHRLPGVSPVEPQRGCSS